MIEGDFNIDAKINGAYIVMGLLYGQGDMDKTIVISCRCGQDSDCNPANAGGILGTVIGRKQLPQKFTSAINPEGVFSHTAYNFPALVDVSEKLVRQAVVRAGGKIEQDANGESVFVIPVQTAQPSALEQCWEPGPPDGSWFTEEEISQIQSAAESAQAGEALKKIAPGWSVKFCGPDMNPDGAMNTVGEEGSS